MSDSLWPHRLQPARLLCPWKSSGKNTGIGGHSLLQGIFPNQGLNPGLLPCKQILYHLSHQGSPVVKVHEINVLGRVHHWAEHLVSAHHCYFVWIMMEEVQFSHSVVSNSLQPHGLQHTRLLPCPSPTPGAYSNSCPLSQWCHPTISSSVVPFSSHLQSFLASGSFQMNQFFASGGQSIGVSASTSVLPMNIQDWSPLGWTGWISLQSKGLSRVFSNTTVQKLSFLYTQLLRPSLSFRGCPFCQNHMARWRFCTHQATAAFVGETGQRGKETLSLHMQTLHNISFLSSWIPMRGVSICLGRRTHELIYFFSQ